jgi:hypothetical protein
MMEDITTYLIQPTVTENGIVRAWEETVLLPHSYRPVVQFQVDENMKKGVLRLIRLVQGKGLNGMKRVFRVALTCNCLKKTEGCIFRIKPSGNKIIVDCSKRI